MNYLFQILLRFLPLPFARLAMSFWYAFLISAVLFLSNYSANEIIYWDQ